MYALRGGTAAGLEDTVSIEGAGQVGEQLVQMWLSLWRRVYNEEQLLATLCGEEDAASSEDSRAERDITRAL